MKTIKKGQEFECVKPWRMESGYNAYIAGKKYTSDNDGCLSNEQGNKLHYMTLNDEFYEHFKLIENMKNTIETPTGCKIAKTEIINGNLIVTYERDLPDSILDLPNVNKSVFIATSTPERAEAILALGQLLELAAYVGIDKYHISFGSKDKQLLDEFFEKYAHLIEKTKKLL